MDTLIGKTLSHYRIVEKIGAGGMGEVYRARDEHLERDAAVKVLPSGVLADDAARKRFRKEAMSLSKLAHPNIAVIHDFDSQEGVDFLVMELVQGETLSERLASGPLPEREVARLGAQLAEGLAAAHREGILHRDIKPANLRVTPEGQLKILDFGLAKLIRATVDATTHSLTAEGHAAGTLPYMAPEQLRGESVDERADLYAAGATLYEMATGKRAFAQPSTPLIAAAILQQAPVPPREVSSKVSSELERIVLKCLQKDPEDRYQTARELAVDLRHVADGTAPRAGVPSERHRRRAGARAIALGVGATVVLALAALTDVGGWRSRILGGSHTGPIRTIAVLPLDNFSRDPEQEYFADGMTEELTTTLAQVGALRVISRTSSMKYKGTKKGLPEIGRELGVDAVVEGSVMRAGDRVRVTAQLIRASTDEHLWAQSYERDLREVLGLQSEVARAIAREIGAKLRPESAGRAGSARRVDPAAYDAYLRGRQYLRSMGEASARKAIARFEEAIRIDSTYAPAWAGLAYGWWSLSTVVVPAREAMPKARAAAIHALDLDPGLAEAHASLGAVVALYDWDWEAGERSLRRAIELNPSSPDGHSSLSGLLADTGRLDEALVEAQTAAELDPLSSVFEWDVAVIHYEAGRYDMAIARLRALIGKDPTSYLAYGTLGLCYVMQGRYAEGIAEFRKMAAVSNNDGYCRVVLCYGLGLWGKTAEARSELEEALKLPRETGGSGIGTGLALCYLGLGDRDRAFRWLEKAYEQRDENLVQLKVNPKWKPLRSDPRYHDLLRRVGLEK